MEAPGVLVARSESSCAALRLSLPQVLAGTHPCLFLTSAQQHGGPSPLPRRPEEESRRLVRALGVLAVQQQQPDLDGSLAWQAGAVLQLQLNRKQQQQRGVLSIGSQLVVLLSADSAALGLFQEGELARHRVLTGYTVRRQQGKAQATYERQGGGARSVGGSIRARETRRLFQSAATTLAEWAPEVAACNQLFRTGTVRVWNELYAAGSPPPPVDRRDPRWQAAGVGVRRPRLADVERVFTALSCGTLEEFQGVD